MSEISKIQGFDLKDTQARKEIERNQNMLSDIRLSNHITYDFSSIKHSQGLCTDENNNLYVYLNNDNVTGDLLVFNLETFELKRTVNGLKLYHGGDLCVVNNSLYAVANYVNPYIIKYDLATAEITELNPFNSLDFDETIGLSKFDNEHLLCSVGYRNGDSSTNDIDSTKLYKVNINTMEIEEIQITNTKNVYLSFDCYQGMEYFDGKLYLATSLQDMIIELVYDEKLNTFNINKIHNLPKFDILGQEIGEYEGLSRVWDNHFGSCSFIIGSTLLDNGTKTFKSYVFDLESNVPALLIKGDIPNNHLERQECIVDANANPTVYFENGSENYPFKTLRRGIAFVNHSPLIKGKQIKLYAGDYTLGTVLYCDFKIIPNGSKGNSINIIDAPTLRNCGNVSFLKPEDSTSIHFKQSVNLDGGIYNFRGVTFEVNIVCKYCDCTLFDNIFSATNKEAVIYAHTNAIVKSGINTINNANAYYYTGNNALLLVAGSVDNSKILSYVSDNLVLKR